jgi:glycine C-acetyltransferase
MSKLASIIARNSLKATLADIRTAGTYKSERIITSPQGMEIMADGKKLLNFCANNYLGWANHPLLIEAAKKTMDTHGYGLSSVRFICGTMDIHKQLEKQITEFHKMEDTILYSSCFDANGGVFDALLTADDALISDELNHASIIDGIRLAKCKKGKYRHMDMKDLEDKLKEFDGCKNKLIVTDGIFSMDGDIAPLQEIVHLAKKYKALTFIDESHSTGFIGKTGRGTPEFFNLEGDIDIINSTLGKALGGATGGYTTSMSELIELMRQKSRPYLFSNSVAPPVVGAAAKAFEILKTDSSGPEKLRGNTERFRTKMRSAGFTILGNDACPIVPVLLKDARLATEFANSMVKYGIYVIGFSFPVVPKGQARIRVQLSAAHTEAQVDQCVEGFIKVAKEKGVIKNI